MCREGLSDIALSSPSEQTAHLLMERSTILRKLEFGDPKQESQRDLSHSLQKEFPQVFHNQLGNCIGGRAVVKHTCSFKHSYIKVSGSWVFKLLVWVRAEFITH